MARFVLLTLLFSHANAQIAVLPVFHMRYFPGFAAMFDCLRYLVIRSIFTNGFSYLKQNKR